MMMTTSPTAIGGIGGSGTRVIAALLQRLNYYIGSDLNEALDNLWFTLLFKRSDILLEPGRSFEWFFDQFWRRMSGEPDLDDESLARIAGLASPWRVQHTEHWLRQRVNSWSSVVEVGARAWGWKEPNTHLVIDRMLELRPDLRYIHVLRNPLDMALSTNQNQLELWGPILLGRPVTLGARDSLSYNCAATRRILQISREYSDRVCMIEFEQVCSDPEAAARRIAAFVGRSVDVSTLSWFSTLVTRGAPAIGRHLQIDQKVFAADDLRFVEDLVNEMNG